MDVTATLDTPCTPDDLFAWVDDLALYPRWLDIVPRAVPDGPGLAAGLGDGDRPAWIVDLRGELGPLARSKRLRMVRTTCDRPRRVIFSREEQDGKSHSPWVLTATVEPLDGSRTRLTVNLHYGGPLWGPVLEALLGDAIGESKPRLLALVTAGAP